ncbi:hypothetical protein [Streptomyces sp. NPDC085466]|uniref:hypothetical protein n=1 Tax=Streptomyces sp. NPDC085466 TaxID=3365725 RepID=UPI0037CFB03B
MDEFVGAAVGFPVLVLTAAVAAVIGFWVLVLCRAVTPDAFEADGAALGFGDSVAAAASVVIAVGWLLDLAGMVVLGRAGLTGGWSLLLSVLLLPGALALSWLLTKRLFGRRRRPPSGARRNGAGGHRRSLSGARRNGADGNRRSPSDARRPHTAGSTRRTPSDTPSGTRRHTAGSAVHEPDSARTAA